MPAPGITERLELAREAAAEAGRGTLRWFQHPDLTADIKGDGSPVTRADREAEDLIRRRIGQAFPNDGVIGEEFGSTVGTSGFTWVLDPIDGTKSFVRGIPTYANLVAVLHDERAVVGVANFPALDELVFAASDLGATWERPGNSRPARVSAQASLGHALVEIVSPASFMREQNWATYERFVRQTARLRGWNDAYAFALAATGRVEAAVDSGIKIWDIAAFQVIMPEAGGRMTDWKGRDTLATDRVILTNGLLHDQVLSALG